MYVDEFPEVSDSFACPGDSRWDTLYTVFTKHWLTHPSPYMKTAHGLPDIPPAASPLPVRPNFAEQLDFAIRALGGGISREPSLERPFSRRKRTPAKTLMVPRPEPVRRKACVREPSRRHMPLPILQEEEVLVRPTHLPNQVRSSRSCRDCSPSARTCRRRWLSRTPSGLGS